MTIDPGLSEREREILTLVATGASNKEIAHQLVLSPNTVKAHLRNIFEKIGVASRTEATMYAIRAGLIDAPLAQAVTEVEVVRVVEVPQRRVLPRWVWVLITVLVVALIGAGYWGGRQLNAQAPAVQPGTDPTRWQTFSDLEFARAHMAAARFERSLYLFSGETSTGLTATSLRYDLTNDEWSEVAAKPTPVKYAQAAAVGDLIYIPGGEDASGHPVDIVEVFNPLAGSWSTVASLPEPRSGYALAPFEGYLYLFGGWDGSRFTGTVYMYDPTANRWEVAGELSSPRGYFNAACIGERIFLFGGKDSHRSLDLVEAFLPNRTGEQSWEQLASLPQPRYNLAVAELAEQIFIFGGQQAESDASEMQPLQYHAQLDRWLLVEQALEPVGSGLALLPVETDLHIFGGQVGEQYSDHHLAYQAIYIVPLPVISDPD